MRQPITILSQAKTSVPAKYFGAFGAGFPKGAKSFAGTNGAMSCFWNPSNTATSNVFNRPGNRRKLSNEGVLQ